MSVDVVSLTCPVCGAPFSPEDDKCSYCGSLLFLRTNHPRIDPTTLNRHVIDDRISDFRKTIRKDPYDATARYGLGVAYFTLGLTDDAVRELEEAARIMPENPNVQSQLAVVLRKATDEGRTGAREKLRDRIEYTLRLAPDNVEALTLKAETDHRISQHERLDIYRRLYEIDPERSRGDYLDFILELANSEEVQGTPEEERLLRRAEEIDPAQAHEPVQLHLYRKAVRLSQSDVATDITNPTRGRDAIAAWRELRKHSPLESARMLADHLLNEPGLTKSKRRSVEKIQSRLGKPAARPTRPREVVQQAKVSTQQGINTMRAVLIGLGKAILAIIAAFVVFSIATAFLPVDHIVVALLAGLILVLVVVTPIYLPIREVRTAKKAQESKQNPAVLEPAPAPKLASPTDREPAVADDPAQFQELLKILRAHLLVRWEAQSDVRINRDPSGGRRAEKERSKVFWDSMK